MFLAFERLDGRSGHAVGRTLLAHLYRKATGEAYPPIVCSPLGKPYFEHSPWHFSISHTKSHAFCVLCDHPVGIDAEPIGRQVSAELAKRYLSAAEQARLGEDPSDALLRLWVLKEAVSKLCGKGIGNWLKYTDFDPNDPRIQIIDGCYVAIVEDRHAV